MTLSQHAMSVGRAVDPIYVDYSIFSTLLTCEEKARLSYVEHLRSIDEPLSLGFGSAFHAGVESYWRTGTVQDARAGFLTEIKRRGTALPISMDADEKRSVERGIYLLECYIEKYQGETYEVMRRPDDGKPYVELGFAVHFMDWKDQPVHYVGKIDSVKRSLVDGRVRNFELKTTSLGLSRYLEQVRPNHQVTGYYLGAKSLGLDPAGTIWDCVYISDRKPDPKKGGWMTFGIDSEKDFGRRETRRSEVDVDEFLTDLRYATTRFLSLRDSKLRRWTRNAPAACYMYGGCQYLEVCATNLNENIIRSKFKVEKWAPWEGIINREVMKA